MTTDNNIPKISIIVPVYNVEKYLFECLDSLVKQTMSDIEIICIDDCSTDNSENILKHFADTDERVRVIKHDVNSGLSASRNTGIKNARSDYIMFCDSDDYYMPETCEKMFDAIRTTDADIACCSIKLLYEDNNKKQNNTDIYTIKKQGVFQLQFDSISEYPVCAVNKIYKKQIILDNNLFFPIGLRYEDCFYWPAYCNYVKRIAFIPDYLYVYRIRSGSIMTTSNISKLNLDPIKIAVTYFKYSNEHNVFAGTENWFWGKMFYEMLKSSLIYSGKNNYKTCYNFAKDFINKNFCDACVDFFTKRKIRLIQNECVLEKNILGFFNIKKGAEKEEIKIGPASIFKKKYTDKKCCIYIFGIKVLSKPVEII